MNWFTYALIALGVLTVGYLVVEARRPNRKRLDFSVRRTHEADVAHFRGPDAGGPGNDAMGGGPSH